MRSNSNKARQRRDALLAQVLDDLAKATMLADELQRALRADALDGLEVVTAEEDTEVDELGTVSARARTSVSIRTYL